MYWRSVGVGHVLFASCFVLLGAISLGRHDFILYQEPVPAGIPGREILAYISALVMLVAGAGLLFRATVRHAALTLTAFFALWVVALWLPGALAHPRVETNWLGVGEDLTLVTGGWLIYCAASGRSGASIRVAQIVFGLALVPIGLSHFFYLQGAANLIPPWMPWRVPLTIVAGAGHIAAGVAIACGLVPRLAATMEASMESLITIIVWVSAIAAKPGDHMYWVNLLISTAETAAAWVVVASYAQGARAPVRSGSVTGIAMAGKPDTDAAPAGGG